MMKLILKKSFYVLAMLFAGYYIIQMVLVFSPATDIFAPH